MSSVPEYLGTTKIYSCADQFLRTWHVWSTCDPVDEIESIYFGNSTSLTCAHGPLTRKDCDTVLERKLWKFAEEQLLDGLIADELIESAATPSSDSNVVSLWEHPRANKR